MEMTVGSKCRVERGFTNSDKSEITHLSMKMSYNTKFSFTTEKSTYIAREEAKLFLISSHKFQSFIC
jgi:hypothetical protein